MADTPPEDTPPLAPQDLDRLVVPPAITMIVLAALSLLFNLIEIVFQPLGRLLDEALHELHYSGRSDFAFGTVLNVFSTLLSLAIAATVLFGGFQMLRKRSWVLALTAAILMMVPCLGPCCPIGIPVGVWALVILLKPEVRQALERAA